MIEASCSVRRVARSRGWLAGVALCFGVVVSAAWPGSSAMAEGVASTADSSRFDYRLSPRELAQGVYVFEAAAEDFSRDNGCNIINTGFIVGGDGVLVINTGPSYRYGEQMAAAIEAVTPLPVRAVLNLNLHPDYFMGNQAFPADLLMASKKTVQGIAQESAAYEDNMYRLCGDWMKGTETRAPAPWLEPGPLDLGGRQLELIELSGHTASDMVVLDRQTGVMFAGGLVFSDRAPTTPHADVKAWLSSLKALSELEFSVIVPSHGTVRGDDYGIRQTADYVSWLDQMFRSAAESGLEMVEVLAAPIPERFQSMGAVREEYVRNVTHLYPRYEREAFNR